MYQQSSGTNGYPKSIRIYTRYGIGGKISTNTYRQPDNTSIATKPEETYMPHRTIRTKVIAMQQHEWRVEFSWIKAHAGHRGNEMADQLAKEAANTKNIVELKYQRVRCCVN